MAVPLDGTDELDQISFNLGASSTHITLMDDSQYILAGQYTTDEDFELDVDFQRSNGILDISQVQENVAVPGDAIIGELDLELNADVAVNRLLINSGIGDLRLDLNALQVNTLEIDGGVGNIVVNLPENGSYRVIINAGIGNIEVRVPDTVDARLDLDIGLTNVDVGPRFDRLESGSYQTGGYASADNRVVIEIDAGMGNVDVR